MGQPQTSIQTVACSVTHGLTAEIPRTEATQERGPNMNMMDKTLCRSLSIQAEAVNEEQMQWEETVLQLHTQNMFESLITHPVELVSI